MVAYNSYFSIQPGQRKLSSFQKRKNPKTQVTLSPGQIKALVAEENKESWTTVVSTKGISETVEIGTGNISSYTDLNCWQDASISSAKDCNIKIPQWPQATTVSKEINSDVNYLPTEKLEKYERVKEEKMKPGNSSLEFNANNSQKRHNSSVSDGCNDLISYPSSFKNMARNNYSRVINHDHGNMNNFYPNSQTGTPSHGNTPIMSTNKEQGLHTKAMCSNSCLTVKTKVKTNCQTNSSADRKDLLKMLYSKSSENLCEFESISFLQTYLSKHRVNRADICRNLKDLSMQSATQDTAMAIALWKSLELVTQVPYLEYKKSGVEISINDPSLNWIYIHRKLKQFVTACSQECLQNKPKQTEKQPTVDINPFYPEKSQLQNLMDYINCESSVNEAMVPYQYPTQNVMRPIVAPMADFDIRTQYNVASAAQTIEHYSRTISEPCDSLYQQDIQRRNAFDYHNLNGLLPDGYHVPSLDEKQINMQFQSFHSYPPPHTLKSMANSQQYTKHPSQVIHHQGSENSQNLKNSLWDSSSQNTVVSTSSCSLQRTPYATESQITNRRFSFGSNEPSQKPFVGAISVSLPSLVETSKPSYNTTVNGPCIDLNTMGHDSFLESILKDSTKSEMESLLLDDLTGQPSMSRHIKAESKAASVIVSRHASRYSCSSSAIMSSVEISDSMDDKPVYSNITKEIISISQQQYISPFNRESNVDFTTKDQCSSLGDVPAEILIHTSEQSTSLAVNLPPMNANYKDQGLPTFAATEECLTTFSASSSICSQISTHLCSNTTTVSASPNHNTQTVSQTVQRFHIENSKASSCQSKSSIVDGVCNSDDAFPSSVLTGDEVSQSVNIYPQCSMNSVGSVTPCSGDTPDGPTNQVDLSSEFSNHCEAADLTNDDKPDASIEKLFLESVNQFILSLEKNKRKKKVVKKRKLKENKKYEDATIGGIVDNLPHCVEEGTKTMENLQSTNESVRTSTDPSLKTSHQNLNQTDKNNGMDSGANNVIEPVVELTEDLKQTNDNIQTKIVYHNVIKPTMGRKESHEDEVDSSNNLYKMQHIGNGSISNGSDNNLMHSSDVNITSTDSDTSQMYKFAADEILKEQYKMNISDSCRLGSFIEVTDAEDFLQTCSRLFDFIEVIDPHDHDIIGGNKMETKPTKSSETTKKFSEISNQTVGKKKRGRKPKDQSHSRKISTEENEEQKKSRNSNRIKQNSVKADSAMLPNIHSEGIVTSKIVLDNVSVSQLATKMDLVKNLKQLSTSVPITFQSLNVNKTAPLEKQPATKTRPMSYPFFIQNLLSPYSVSTTSKDKTCTTAVASELNIYSQASRPIVNIISNSKQDDVTDAKKVKSQLK